MGIMIDERFSWGYQAEVVHSNVGFLLSGLWHFADVTPILTRRKLVQSLICYVVMLSLGRYCNGCLKRKDSTKHRFLLMNSGKNLPEGWCVLCVVYLHRISYCSRLERYCFMTLNVFKI
jgi:hypothetical protein